MISVVILTIVWSKSIEYVEEGNESYFSQFYNQLLHEVMMKYGVYVLLCIFLTIGFPELNQGVYLVMNKLFLSMIIVARKTMYYIFFINIIDVLSK